MYINSSNPSSYNIYPSYFPGPRENRKIPLTSKDLPLNPPNPSSQISPLYRPDTIELSNAGPQIVSESPGSTFPVYTKPRPARSDSSTETAAFNTAANNAPYNAANDAANTAAPAVSSDTSSDASSDASSDTPSETSSDKTDKSRTSQELTPEEKKEVEQLKETDKKVKAHEAAHKAAAGGLAIGGATFGYTTGPDNKRYATSGEVSIDTSPVPNDPDATIKKMQTVQKAALAPAQPSGQDRKVASQASRTMAQARMDKMKAQSQSNKPSDSDKSADSNEESDTNKQSGKDSDLKV
jgi:hypothetical protein